MAELKWTTDKPTRNGWYWHRVDELDDWQVVEVNIYGKFAYPTVWFARKTSWYRLKNMGGQWCGPLAPPE